MHAEAPRDFTPALGRAWLTPLYDAAIGTLTRERFWRRTLLSQVTPQINDRILDVGCGTGTLAILLKRSQPRAAVFGVDPDGNVLARAHRKAAAAGVEIQFIEGFLDKRIFGAIPQPTKVVSSLVFHQVPLEEKRRMLAIIRSALPAGGELHIADYGLQRTRLMRLLFRTVQALDGKANTEPNAQGALPRLMTDAGFSEVQETRVIATPTGSISLYRARVPSRESGTSPSSAHTIPNN